MRKALLDTRTADLLAKIAGMFGSEHPGERAAAAAQAHALMTRLDMTWRDLFFRLSELPSDTTAIRSDWRRMAKVCGLNVHRFDPREAKFVRDMLVIRWQPSGSQLDWLIKLYRRIACDAPQMATHR
ncbi:MULTISPECIES: hypothetical protein [unclassified Bradyrhizobium]|uniref:hypothetical protein n=1 Tax=unclassified Bradyrhizobium TaxID=2631580 RepID=UPI0029168A8E|nr:MULTISPECIES: hypothetical protein [unclassified Bradyrhizobium]